MSIYWDTNMYFPAQPLTRSLLEAYWRAFRDAGWQPENPHPERSGSVYFSGRDGTWNQAVQHAVVAGEVSIQFWTVPSSNTVREEMEVLFGIGPMDVPWSLDIGGGIGREERVLRVGLSLSAAYFHHDRRDLVNFDALHELTCRLFAAFEPLYAYGDTDVVGYGRRIGGKHGWTYCFGPSYREITGRTLPPLFWLNYFSPAHQHLLPMERLLSTPAHHVRLYDNGSVSIFLGHPIFDAERESDDSVNAAAAVAEHLNLPAWHLPEGHPLLLSRELWH